MRLQDGLGTDSLQTTIYISYHPIILVLQICLLSTYNGLHAKHILEEKEYVSVKERKTLEKAHTHIAERGTIFSVIGAHISFSNTKQLKNIE